MPFFRRVGRPAPTGLALVWLGLFALSTPAAAKNKTGGASKRPKLLVIVSVDQMRADYLEQYGRAWKKGLRRLYKEGAVFSEARYPYLNTVTCAGHTTIGTGTFPNRHGMVLNAWYSRELNRSFECTEDPDAPTIFYDSAQPAPKLPPVGHSARNMQVPTLVDVLKGAGGGPGLEPRPKVASFSNKARSAIGMVGNGGDVVTWFDLRSFSTSRKFTPGPDPVVAAVLAKTPVERLVAKPWSKRGPASAYRFSDEGLAEVPPMPFWSKVFPHPLRVPITPDAGPLPARPLAPLAAWDRSAFTDEMLLAFAEAALDSLKLGQAARTDVLAVSFSALDSVGHAFGPRSHEVQDVLIRLDGLLGQLLARLDRRVGKGKYVLALTSDHGVAVVPEQLIAEGKDAGRVPAAVVRQRLKDAISAEIGAGEHVRDVRYTDLYLGTGVLDRLRGKPGAIERVKAAVRSIPGVAAVFTTDQLRDPAAATDPLQKAAALSHFPARSGDFILAPKPNWLTTPAGTTHGTANDYDQHVPLVFFGAGIKRGRYKSAASPADLAPTLGHLVGVAMPTAQGRVLGEALSKRGARAERARQRK